MLVTFTVVYSMKIKSKKFCTVLSIYKGFLYMNNFSLWHKGWITNVSMLLLCKDLCDWPIVNFSAFMIYNVYTQSWKWHTLRRFLRLLLVDLFRLLLACVGVRLWSTLLPSWEACNSNLTACDRTHNNNVGTTVAWPAIIAKIKLWYDDDDCDDGWGIDFWPLSWCRRKIPTNLVGYSDHPGVWYY